MQKKGGKPTPEEEAEGEQEPEEDLITTDFQMQFDTR